MSNTTTASATTSRTDEPTVKCAMCVIDVEGWGTAVPARETDWVLEYDGTTVTSFDGEAVTLCGHHLRQEPTRVGTTDASSTSNWDRPVLCLTSEKRAAGDHAYTVFFGS
jgi:hypothetical protein